MDLGEALFLGVIQGFGEWLPVSSEGLVTLFSTLIFGSSFEYALAVAIWLHLGTLFAALLYLRKDVRLVLQGFKGDNEGRRLLRFLIVATLSSAVTAAPLLLFLRGLELSEKHFTITVGLLLIVTALVQRRAASGEQKIDTQTALVAGLLQGLSIMPGISRSGITLVALVGLGFNVRDALRLSYLMSIPAIAAAQVLPPLLTRGFTASPEMFAGAFAAFAVGLLTMRMLLSAAARLDRRLFMIPLGVAIVLLGLLL
ncbi:undecaprenyl-diphosphatase [Candidatus Caldarchaeum subterraneum]|uniref:Undecaprenyl-diphosphatase n=1 Tax=Caldiarchaeum subterraneum TaxID=311458 RepID=E6N4A1_CALS0|nr:undecaprenyl-diphosphatase [Candidatus Caldarchaeum subterraneum]BAJ49947.1 undecaprenyl-diphosphatase [Candidatus Caldarchaeum subterraneum]